MLGIWHIQLLHLCLMGELCPQTLEESVNYPKEDLKEKWVNFQYTCIYSLNFLHKGEALPNLPQGIWWYNHISGSGQESMSRSPCVTFIFHLLRVKIFLSATSGHMKVDETSNSTFFQTGNGGFHCLSCMLYEQRGEGRFPSYKIHSTHSLK